jgi:hypothetical protein
MPAEMTARACKVLVVAAACASALTPTASGAGAPARAAGGCGIPNGGENLGPTYLTSLTVSDTTCAVGLKVVRAYHVCQVKHGGLTARCTAAVDGFRCKEKRGPSIPTEFYSSVSCTDHAQRVSYQYSQFTT